MCKKGFLSKRVAVGWLSAAFALGVIFTLLVINPLAESIAPAPVPEKVVGHWDMWIGPSESVFPLLLTEGVNKIEVLSGFGPIYVTYFSSERFVLNDEYALRHETMGWCVTSVWFPHAEDQYDVIMSDSPIQIKFDAPEPTEMYLAINGAPGKG